MGLCLSRYCNYGTNEAYDAPIWNNPNTPIVYARPCDNRSKIDWFFS